MNINKTKIERRMKSKTDLELVRTIITLKKTNPLIAKELSKPKRKWPSVNLEELNELKGDVIIAGKVLGSGDLTKKKRIVAWGASEKAIERINSAGGEFISIVEELIKNPELKNLELIR
ncbi:MAG: uL15 family ribosomal protein [archaeon]